MNIISTNGSKEYMHVLYTNADGLANKLTELKVMLTTGKYKAICVTETHFQGIPNPAIEIPQFELFREDRQVGRKGSSAIYIHKSYSAKQLNFFHHMESLALRVSNDEGHSFILVCLYRSSNISIDENQNIINEVHRLCKSMSNEDILIMGDVNLPDVHWNAGKVVCPKNSI